MTEQQVSFANCRGQFLSGVLHRPSGNHASRGAILCHGMESNKESEKLIALAGRLSDKDFLTLRFDFACANEGSGKFEDVTYSGEVEDLSAAFRFLLQHDVDKIGVFGSSMGGTVALLFAAQVKKLASLVTLAAPVHPEKITEHLLSPQQVTDWRRTGYTIYHGRRINVTMLDDLESINVPQAIAEVRCPTLVIHGDRDETVPVAEGHELFSLLPGAKELMVIRGADHRFSDPDHLEKVINHATDWLTSHSA
jgi:pimeloyl-ACP methyl ester carboxylesterase